MSKLRDWRKARSRLSRSECSLRIRSNDWAMSVAKRLYATRKIGVGLVRPLAAALETTPASLFESQDEPPVRRRAR